MRFGIFSNGQRLKNSFVSYDEDVREIVIADRLGFAEAWISEHTGQTWMPHAVPAAELLISRAASLTEKILMGPAVRRISLYTPQMRPPYSRAVYVRLRKRAAGDELRAVGN
jgi:alkanesulfonate monooxygenase SsuD/methylene tetrahydromethanopterin reductase-like flavin-dependent oxidoreductase (luciferase family)